MKITKKHIATLAAAGVTAETHHATIKKEFSEAFGHKLAKDEVQTIRDMMAAPAPAKKAAKSAPAPEAVEPPSEKELLKMAREYLTGIGQDGKRVVRVTEITAKGGPARVVVRCTDPQTTSQGDSVCEETREVAIQDVFQVLRCEPCQKRAVQLYRNRLARNRRAELAKLRSKA